jgi:hypothetical protein
MRNSSFNIVFGQLLDIHEYGLAFRLFVQQWRIICLQKEKTRYEKKRVKLLKKSETLRRECEVLLFKEEINLFSDHNT